MTALEILPNDALVFNDQVLATAKLPDSDKVVRIENKTVFQEQDFESIARIWLLIGKDEFSEVCSVDVSSALAEFQVFSF